MAPEPLTRVATRVRALTLACQFVSSAVATLALAHPCALTGAAQGFGLAVSLLVCLGTAVSVWARAQTTFGCGAWRADFSSLARSPRTHFYACAFVDAALLVSTLLLVGNTEDSRVAEAHSSEMKKSAFHRVEVAAFASALGWGTHVAHCAVAYVVYRTTERNTVLVELGGLYEPLMSDATDVEAAALGDDEKGRVATPAAAAA
jgi:hypothetical protein